MRTLPRVIYCLAIVAALALGACSGNRFRAYKRIGGFRKLEPMTLEANADKAVSSMGGRLVYTFGKASQEICFYRDGKRVNTLGGLGFDRTSFQRLSDIGVDQDGSLLALDSALKVMRKFTPEGRLLSELKLNRLIQPELFCGNTEGNFYVYDAASSEIVCLSQFDMAEQYRFGRFVVEQPSSLACNQEYLWVYSQRLDRTCVFYLLGQFKEALEGQVAFDSFNNPVRIADIDPGWAAKPSALMRIDSSVVSLSDGKLLQLVELLHVGGELAP